MKSKICEIILESLQNHTNGDISDNANGVFMFRTLVDPQKSYDDALLEHKMKIVNQIALSPVYPIRFVKDKNNVDIPILVSKGILNQMRRFPKKSSEIEIRIPKGEHIYNNMFNGSRSMIFTELYIYCKLWFLTIIDDKVEDFIINNNSPEYWIVKFDHDDFEDMENSGYNFEKIDDNLKNDINNVLVPFNIKDTEYVVITRGKTKFIIIDKE